MATCLDCGRKVFFGHLNSEHLCKNCAEIRAAKRKAEREAAEEAAYIQEHYGAHDTTDEESACKFFIEEFVKEGKNTVKFHIKHPNDEYTSLYYAMTEILRIRISDTVKWIAINMDEKSKEKYRDHALFEWQRDKSQTFWRSYFTGMADLFVYSNILLGISLPDYYGIGRELKAEEVQVARRIYEMFLSCGADPEEIYIYELSNAFEILYGSLGGRIRVKMTGEGMSGAIVDSEISGGSYAFTNRKELDVLQEEYIPMKIAKGASMEMDMHRYRHYYGDM